jgi:hypothetical protein
MNAVLGLGLEPVLNPLHVPAAADYFGDPQHDIPRWNETTFFEAWAPDNGVGVFLHMGRYPKDLDVWWCQAITYLPAGRLTSDINWGRTRDAGARTGNVVLDVIEPLQRWTLSYDGAGELTDSDRLVRGPSGAGVQVLVRWDLDVRAIGPIWDMQPPPDGSMPDFAQSSHSQQTYRVTGTITVDGVPHPVDGIGCNDHSRGARDLTHFSGDQWVVGIMPGYTFHAINVWKQDQTPVLEVGAWFDRDGYRSVKGRRHPVHAVSNEPRAFDLVIDDTGTEHVFALEVLHGCTICVTQQHDNLNGVDWNLSGDTVLLNESPIRITAASGEVGYGHLERSTRLDQARESVTLRGG